VSRWRLSSLTQQPPSAAAAGRAGERRLADASFLSKEKAQCHGLPRSVATLFLFPGFVRGQCGRGLWLAVWGQVSFMRSAGFGDVRLLVGSPNFGFLSDAETDDVTGCHGRDTCSASGISRDRSSIERETDVFGY
jgi:hypothetical protein